MATYDRSTIDLLRSSRIMAWAVGLLSLAAGIVLIAWPDRTVLVVARLVGVLFAVTGLGQCLEALTSHRRGSYWGLLLLRGVVNLGFGLALVFWPGVTVTVAVWLLGINLIVTGVLGLAAGTQVPKELGRSSFFLHGAVALVFGLIIVIWPDVSAGVLTGGLAILVGIGLVLLGLVFLATAYQLGRAQPS